MDVKLYRNLLPAQRSLLVQEGLLDPHQSFLPNRDLLLCSQTPRDITGVCLLRPMYYAHSFRFRPGTLPRRSADALFHYACGLAQASGIQGTLFQVSHDNDTMRRFALSHGAVAESDCDVYRYDLPL